MKPSAIFRKPRYLILFWVLLVWVMPAIACNYPGRRNNQGILLPPEMQQTLMAQFRATEAEKLREEKAQDTPIPTGLDEERSTQTPRQPAIPPEETQNTFHNYIAQSGDTLQAIAMRFAVPSEQISSDTPIPSSGYINSGQKLSIPVDADLFPMAEFLLPDSEVIDSPTTIDFDIHDYVIQAGGYLSRHTEMVDNREISGAEIVEKVSRESSVNPRLLLAFVEDRTGWVYGPLRTQRDLDNPIGFQVPDRRGLYQELVMTATHLNIGYYGWRSGTMNSLRFVDGTTQAINPWLNPGSVGLQNLFAKFYKPAQWTKALYGAQNFIARYQQMFGDPWHRAAQVDPLLYPGIELPELELPFQPGERWSLTGGPHFSWNSGSPRGAIDFSPVTGEPACSISRAWVTASADGVIARSAHNVVALDLDGDGYEQTGWVLIYLHIADAERIPAGQTVSTGERLGHPSCERGSSTGTHIHLARKYNGEWIEADGPLPFHLSGWLVFASANNYQGGLIKGNDQVVANPSGTRTSIITR